MLPCGGLIPTGGRSSFFLQEKNKRVVSEKIKNRNGRVGVFPVNESSWMDIGQWKNYQQTLKRFDAEITL